ncbi:hypothetical protein G5B46_05550 [Caulobacter sp. 602-2]|uniref:Uncharacterized protein n=1 Tax=Caulobacter sp. 602-2 TaxID=2710887 RepID=A0A6G4QUF1_9CAUL|nr:hypothetical protein [Caulobacter sp. 602-2]NGM49067.1 hypothetical protein [Caulobacter sp. 602-2]
MPPAEVEGRLAAIVGPPGDPESELLVGWSREGEASLEERHHKGGGTGFRLLVAWRETEVGSQVNCRFLQNHFYLIFIGAWVAFALTGFLRMPDIIQAFLAGEASVPGMSTRHSPGHQLFLGTIFLAFACAVPFIVRWSIVSGRRDLLQRASEALSGGPISEVRE